MGCAACGKDNPEGAAFCGNCGARLEEILQTGTRAEKTCPKCGAKNPPNFAFCASCGGILTREVAVLTAKRRRWQWVIVGGLILLLLVGGGAGFYWWSRTPSLESLLLREMAFRHIEDERRTKAIVDISVLETALDLYYIDTGSYPTTDRGLKALIAQPAGVTRWNGPYLKQRQVPLDPWGNPYLYESDGKGYVLFSSGKDGQPNTNDDVRPD